MRLSVFSYSRGTVVGYFDSCMICNALNDSSTMPRICLRGSLVIKLCMRLSTTKLL